MRRGRKEMGVEVKEWSEEQGLDAVVIMELSDNISGDRVRNWVEDLMRRERSGRRFYGKCTSIEVEEIKRLGITKPIEVVRGIEKKTVRMVEVL